MKYAICGTARSGTSLLYQFIKSTNSEKYNELKAFFNNEFIMDETEYGLAHNQNIQGADVNHTECVTKLLDYDFSIKFTVSMVWESRHLIQTLLDNDYQLILIERKNKYDQMLSLLLAEATDIWHLDKNITLDKTNLSTTGDLSIIDQFIANQIWFNQLREEFPDHVSVFYEDIVNGDFSTVTEQINLMGSNPDIQIQKIYKSIAEKEQLITNLTEVQTYYNYQALITGLS